MVPTVYRRCRDAVTVQMPTLRTQLIVQAYSYTYPVHDYCGPTYTPSLFEERVTRAPDNYGID